MIFSYIKRESIVYRLGRNESTLTILHPLHFSLLPLSFCNVISMTPRTRGIRLVTQFSFPLSHINESIYLPRPDWRERVGGGSERTPLLAHAIPDFLLCVPRPSRLRSLEPEILPHISRYRSEMSACKILASSTWVPGNFAMK